MDFFQRLPTLVLTSILGHVESDRDLFILLRASPEALRIYVRYRQIVKRQRLAGILGLDLDGTILQDAQTIIHFPTIGLISSDSAKAMRAATQCLRTWDAQEYSNPVAQSHRENTKRLCDFFSRIILFIEDYISKSLDPFPARACMTLPTISRLTSPMQFKGQETDVQPVTFGQMGPSMKRRLLQAFVRYELRCKVYYPPLWSGLKSTVEAQIMKRSNRSLTLSAHEEIRCIDEYLKGVYCALFAQCQDSWFPDRSGQSNRVGYSEHYDLLFPDNEYFSVTEYSGGILTPDTDDSLLPCLRLDFLCSILLSFKYDESGQDWIRDCCESVIRQLGQRPSSWIDGKHFTMRRNNLRTDDTRCIDWMWRLEDENDRRQFARTEPEEAPIDVERNVRQLRMQYVQSRTYRQRAWIFFSQGSTSTRSQPCLPSWDVLAEQERSTRYMMALTYQRQRRRSQRLQDYWSDRSLVHPFELESSSS